jgi:hypothetical protein
VLAKLIVADEHTACSTANPHNSTLPPANSKPLIEKADASIHLNVLGFAKVGLGCVFCQSDPVERPFVADSG